VIAQSGPAPRPVHRVLEDEGREVVLEVAGSSLSETTPSRTKRSEHRTPLRALVAMHRRASALGHAGMIDDVARSTGELTVLDVRIELPLGRSEVELRLGEHLAARGTAGLPDAVPLLFLEWPVGYRFASLFEAHPRDRAARSAVATAVAELEPPEVAACGELLRVALVQRNVAALAPALALLPSVRSFDTWMDVLELCDDVGDRRHAATLRALAKGRVPKDARDSLGELARDLGRR
jgi:hypothetical protein